MGTSTSGSALGRKFMALAEGLGDTSVPLNATALHVKRIMEQSAASAGALGNKPAGKRKAIGVRYDIRGGKGSGQALIAYVGPAHLINNPTSRHFIGASAFGSRKTLAGAAAGIGAVSAFGGTARGMLSGLKGSRRRRGTGKRALTIGGNLRPYAFHPGTAGKGFFQKAKVRAIATAPSVYARKGLTDPLRKAFAA